MQCILKLIFSPYLFVAALALQLSAIGAEPPPLFVRASQLGYGPNDAKTAIAYSTAPLPDHFCLFSNDDNKPVLRGSTHVVREVAWGQFTHFAELDFSRFSTRGTFAVSIGGARSLPFTIGAGPVATVPGMLGFMRQQRCGTNSWLSARCHEYDGRTAYGPLAPGTFVDSRGGWHDAADLLKYLLTSGNATAQMLLASLLAGESGISGAHQVDVVDAVGEPGSNGVPDLLDEARWGLDWMRRLHPAADHLYHQVADDRDHAGRRLPQNENVDYGWGKGSNRVVYFADGRPQGLQQYQSESTGVANLAGRYAAAMALAWQIWKDDPGQAEFAAACLQAGIEVYALGRAQEGVQQGNSYKAPYRYEETTWADDMEWGAAELYRATGERRYLEQAMHYAVLAGSESWMGKEQARHYQYYPFMNLGHFRLYNLVDRRFKRVLAGYYQEGIERCVAAGRKNPFRVGVPFIWCSNNLVAALATQCFLYERMTGDRRYRQFAANQRDWLLGRNPWGYCMFTGLGPVSPKDPHLMTMQLTRRPVAGGLVDGPVYERIFKSLKGVSIVEPDEQAAFHGPAVYHDDYQDYSTNEPTMDGTASAILLMIVAATQPNS